MLEAPRHKRPLLLHVAPASWMLLRQSRSACASANHEQYTVHPRCRCESCTFWFVVASCSGAWLVSPKTRLRDNIEATREWEFTLLRIGLVQHEASEHGCGRGGCRAARGSSASCGLDIHRSRSPTSPDRRVLARHLHHAFGSSVSWQPISLRWGWWWTHWTSRSRPQCGWPFHVEGCGWPNPFPHGRPLGTRQWISTYRSRRYPLSASPKTEDCQASPCDPEACHPERLLDGQECGRGSGSWCCSPGQIQIWSFWGRPYLESFPGFFLLRKDSSATKIRFWFFFKMCFWRAVEGFSGRRWMDASGWLVASGSCGALVSWGKLDVAYEAAFPCPWRSGCCKSTIKLQFGPVADDMLEGGKPAIYRFMMAGYVTQYRWSCGSSPSPTWPRHPVCPNKVSGIPLWRNRWRPRCIACHCTEDTRHRVGARAIGPPTRENTIRVALLAFIWRWYQAKVLSHEYSLGGLGVRQRTQVANKTVLHDAKRICPVNEVAPLNILTQENAELFTIWSELRQSQGLSYQAVWLVCVDTKVPSRSHRESRSGLPWRMCTGETYEAKQASREMKEKASTYFTIVCIMSKAWTTQHRWTSSTQTT